MGVASSDQEPFIVPLSIPGMAGPSSMATVMLLAAQSPSGVWKMVGALSVVMAREYDPECTWALLRERVAAPHVELNSSALYSKPCRSAAPPIATCRDPEEMVSSVELSEDLRMLMLPLPIATGFAKKICSGCRPTTSLEWLAGL